MIIIVIIYYKSANRYNTDTPCGVSNIIISSDSIEPIY